jgi:peroxiredoxin
MLENHEGQNVPQVVFPTRQDHEWVNISSDEIFKGKTVIVFSLPGAFTPTCSSTHVPRYNQLANTFKQQGVDEVVCVSVNDTFVMNQWKAEQQADNITFLADGNQILPAVWVCWLQKMIWVLATVHGAIRCWLKTASSKKCLSSPIYLATLSKYRMLIPC